MLRIRYLVDYATGYYAIQFCYCFLVMPAWCYSSMKIWVGFEIKECAKGFILVDLINMFALLLYTAAYSLLAIPAIPLTLYYWRPLLEKLRNRLLQAFFQNEAEHYLTRIEQMIHHHLNQIEGQAIEQREGQQHQERFFILFISRDR